MSFKMKLNLVNKHKYEEDEDYREIIIKIPKEQEKLEKDFEYLGIDYNNLSIQDTNVLECEVIDTEDLRFSSVMTTELSNIIARANEAGWTTPYEDIKSMFEIIKVLNSEDREKLLAVLELKKGQICNMQDAIKYGTNLNCFEFHRDVYTYEDYAEKLIYDESICLNDIIDFIDTKRMGKVYVNSNEGMFTDQGLIFENNSLDRKIKTQENEEEFE